MTDEHGRRDPPPGWEYYTVTDDDGAQWPSFNVRRTGPNVLSCDEAWAEIEQRDSQEFEISGEKRAVEKICEWLRSPQETSFTREVRLARRLDIAMEIEQGKWRRSSDD